MTVKVRWRASRWEKFTPLWCHLFGHVWTSGWWGDQPYFRGEYMATDGINRDHFKQRQIGYSHTICQGIPLPINCRCQVLPINQENEHDKTTTHP